MSPKKHALISAFLGGTVFYATQSVSSGIACFLVGTAIDIDHLYDYFRYVGFRFDLKSFLSNYYFGETGQCFIWLHSYEWLPMIWALCYFFQLPQLGIGISVGLLGHLLCDQFTNPVRPFAYFLSYRLMHNFRISKNHHGS